MQRHAALRQAAPGLAGGAPRRRAAPAPARAAMGRDPIKIPSEFTKAREWGLAGGGMGAMQDGRGLGGQWAQGDG